MVISRQGFTEHMQHLCYICNRVDSSQRSFKEVAKSNSRQGGGNVPTGNPRL